MREEIGRLEKLITQAKSLEAPQCSVEAPKLRSILHEEGIFGDPKMKLLVFTEHKDTLDYLAGDGRDERPLGKLREWGLTLTQIHGGMKIGDRDTPGSRIYAEREFHESAQVLVATEAAGEGINLQFCWLMINFDIPWNPVRAGTARRPHPPLRSGARLPRHQLRRPEHPRRTGSADADRPPQEIRRELGTDQVFDVVGEVFPSNLLEKLFRDMYARQTDEHKIQDRIVRDVSPDRFRAITECALEGLAKKELNLSAIVGKSAEAKEHGSSRRSSSSSLSPRLPRVVCRPSRSTKNGEAARRAACTGSARSRNISSRSATRKKSRFGRLGREYSTNRIRQNVPHERRDPGMGDSRASAV